MPESRRAAIALGGNIGDVAASFSYALARLARTRFTNVTSHSSVYRTAPWGRTDQAQFLNMAALVETSLSVFELLALCKAIEKEKGRVCSERWGPRTLDIDLIAYGEETIKDKGLALPHPHATRRAFVLIPLQEIAPNLRLDGKTVEDWAAACDRSGVALDRDATALLSAPIRPSEGTP